MGNSDEITQVVEMVGQVVQLIYRYWFWVNRVQEKK